MPLVRRRNILAISFTSFTLFIVLFGKAAYKSFNSTSAEIISDVVSHESISLQTSELAAAVVSHVLNDPEVLGKASKVGKWWGGVRGGLWLLFVVVVFLTHVFATFLRSSSSSQRRRRKRRRRFHQS